jgi:hypothetical protein
MKKLWWNFRLWWLERKIVLTRFDKKLSLAIDWLLDRLEK